MRTVLRLALDGPRLARLENSGQGSGFSLVGPSGRGGLRKHILVTHALLCPCSCPIGQELQRCFSSQRRAVFWAWDAKGGQGPCWTQYRLSVAEPLDKHARVLSLSHGWQGEALNAGPRWRGCVLVSWGVSHAPGVPGASRFTAAGGGSFSSISF